MQTTIEIRYKDYWVILDCKNLLCLEVTPLVAEQYEIKMIFNHLGNDLTDMNIQRKFTINEVEAIVESVKAIKNPRIELPTRGFFSRLFS